MKYILVLLVIILAGCSTKTDKKLNLIGKELEKLNQQIQVGNMLLIQEVDKTNKLLKKEAEKCDQWGAYAVAPYTFRIVRYCPDAEKKQGLMQSDIDSNKNNQLR